MTVQWTFTAAAQRLHRALVARRETKRALRAYREERGSCEVADSRPDPEDGVLPCYRSRFTLTFDEWCEPCRNSQPLWETYRAAATEQAAAMRCFIAAGKRAELAVAS